MLHIREEIDIDPAAAGIDMVIFGHSHKPEEYVKDGVIWLNPGSAGPRRFSLPVTLSLLHLRGGKYVAESIRLTES